MDRLEKWKTATPWEMQALLKAYEETGLTPEEIAGLQEALGGKEVADWAVEAVACRKEAAAANLERFRLQKENQRLRSVLSGIYPAIAGRVIALEQAGETVAHGQWAEMARKIYKALEVGK